MERRIDKYEMRTFWFVLSCSDEEQKLKVHTGTLIIQTLAKTERRALKYYYRVNAQKIVILLAQ